MESDDDDEEDYREKVTIEEMNSPLPAAADGVTFESFIRNKQDFETFKEFLERRNNKGEIFNAFYSSRSVCKSCFFLKFLLIHPIFLNLVIQSIIYRLSPQFSLRWWLINLLIN